MRLREIMAPKVVTAKPREAASAAWTRMRRRNIGHLVVLEDDRPIGVLSERDLGGRSGGSTRRGRMVEDLMTARVVSAEPETTVREAADLMRQRLIGSLPVMDGDRLVGIVTATDVFDALGRDAERSQVRVPLADRVPKAAKRSAGRTRASQVPANIRLAGVGLDQDDKDFIRRRLGERLGKHANSIERVTVRVTDVNGPRGGVDLSCSIKVVLSGLPSVVVENRAATFEAALNGALAAAERTVRRSLQRRRTRPATAAARKSEPER